MDIYVDYSCEENSQTGRTKITVCDFDSTSIRDVKYAIQEAIQAPVCDQQLFYQGQRVTDDNMPLSRLYFREGDCFNVQFLAAADISGMREQLEVLKNFAREIVERFNRELPDFNTKEDPRGFYDLYRGLHSASRSMEELSDSFFSPWRSLKSLAQKHFFVQEGGFEALLEVFKFSRQLYHDFDVQLLYSSLDQNKHKFNQGLLFVQSRCLGFLWNFGETPQDLRFLLSKDVFSLAVDALLLEPCPIEDTGHTDIARRIVGVNEDAVGCFGVLVEYDSSMQEKVSKMPQLIDKLIFMMDRCQSEPAVYSLYSSQVASNAMLYCTFNVKSVQPLVDCGALEKILNITQKLLIDKNSYRPLRYYCCLFLARMRSAPLVTLDRDTCVVIDELIDEFLGSHDPNEVSKWEEEDSYVWITMTPLVHLAFAAGKEYYCQKIDGLKSGTKEKEGALESKLSETTTMEEDKGRRTNIKRTQKPVLSLDNIEELYSQKTCKCRMVEDELASPDTLRDISESMETVTSMSDNDNCVTVGTNTQFTWPGSTSTQKLGIFSLVHMLSIKENQQLALSENLLPYLVCLSWHLKCDEREKLRTCLANFHNVTTPPSLKVAAKCVLALVNGLDMVYNL